MKRFVNGVEVELAQEAGVTVTPFVDRLIVHGPDGAHSAVAVRIGDRTEVSYRGRLYKVEKAVRTRSARGVDSGEIRAPMPGLIVDVLVAEGDEVVLGQKLIVLEAMKTQQSFSAPFDGRVAAVHAQPQDQVEEGRMLMVLNPTPLPD